MKKPIYNFNDETSTGVDLVPDNSFIHIESFSGEPRTIVVLAGNGLTGASTVQNLIDQPTWWAEIGASGPEQGGVLWLTTTDYVIGDIVTDDLDSGVYKAILDNTASQPSAAASLDWEAIGGMVTRNLANPGNPGNPSVDAYDANANELLVCSTNGATLAVDQTAYSINLPATPADGDTVRIMDGSGNAQEQPVLVYQGPGIDGNADDLTCDVNWFDIKLAYNATSNNWALSGK